MQDRAADKWRYFEANEFPGTTAPQHCALVKAPPPLAFLRIDCAEQAPADPATERRNQEAFA